VTIMGEASYEGLIGTLYQGALDDAPWDRGLKSLAALVDGEGPLLMSINPATHALRRYQCYSYDPAVVSTYLTEWVSHDIRIAPSLRMPLLEPFPEAHTVGRRKWEQSAIFNEFLYANDCPWTLHTQIHRNERRATSLTIQGTRTRGPFSQEDVDAVRPLLPHVRRALEIKDRLTAHGIHAGVLNSVIDSLSFGVVVLDQSGKVIEASPAALCYLNDVCATPPLFNSVLEFNEPCQREFQTLLSLDLCHGRLADGLLHIPRGPQRLPLAILIGPAPAVARSWVLNTPRWLLFVFDPERRVAPVAAFLEKDLLLSAREAQIAAEWPPD
jgi:hypothetical protein